eukprot:GFKZ01001989.1.p1 GENE.GFKZ01001989.1~~GFKZ01001989.1.p1  ORF type:complete len:325 (-),score=42.50 GFKZ01001989.1:1114-2088(-)
MSSVLVSAEPIPTSPPLQKPLGKIRALKLFLVFLLGLLSAYLGSQIIFSEIGEKNLPGSMPYFFQQHPGQNLSRLLTGQKIFALRTQDISYAACLIPKNSCSYHIGLMQRVNGVKNYENFSVVHNATAKLDLDISRFRHKRIIQWLADPDIPRYAIVRNPLMRTLSAYLDKVEDNYEDGVKSPDRFERWLEEEFPKGSGKQRDARLWNPHWRPQYHYCGFSTENVHKALTMLRFEEPEKIVDYLYKFIPRRFLDDGWGREDSISLREFMLGPRKRTGGTEQKFLTYFRSVETYDKLVAELQDDIRSFGYQEEVDALRNQVLVRR